MLNKCKINDDELLLFGTEEDLKFPEYFHIENIEANVKITKDNESLPILSAQELKSRIFSHKRTTDIVLGENGINSYSDLKAAYFLIRYKKLNASKKVRELIVKKYEMLSEYIEIYEENNK